MKTFPRAASVTALAGLFAVWGAPAIAQEAKDGPVVVQETAAGDLVIENDFVRLVVSPAKGGAITEVRQKKALVLPFIAEKGAQVAGTGRFFLDAGAVVKGEAEEAFNLADAAYAAEIVERGPDAARIRLAAKADAVAPGLVLERELAIGRAESGLILTRTVRNGGAQALALRIGSRFEQQAEPWRTDLRLWMGNGNNFRWVFGPYNQGPEQTFSYPTPVAQWQLLSQYGVGIVARTEGLAAPVAFAVEYPKEAGVPCKAQWTASPITIQPGQAVSLKTDVLVCEGLRQIGPLGEGRVAAAGYMQGAARPGESFPVFGVVASATRRTVKVGIERYYHNERGPRVVEPLGAQDITLEPGLAREVRYEMTAPEAGLLYATCYIEADGKRLAAGGSRTWVYPDAEGLSGEPKAAMDLYLRKMPELRYEGTWAQIGRQLAKEGKIKPGQARGNAADILAMYRRRFPFYAEILEGAAAEHNVPIERLVAAQGEDGRPFASAFDAAPAGSACMAFYLNGPDGPICAYSKERSGSGVSGQGYMKVIPDKGYKFHMYTLGGWNFGYGINEKGLATGGATINCDPETDRAGAAATKAWRDAGRVTAPLGLLMMFASCATVEEAIAFIENEDAPLDFTGNMLLVDRAGDAAVLQSVGIKHMIRRYDGPKDRLEVGAPIFSATNYSHPDAEGFFKPGPNWAWHANGLLREWRVGEFVRELNGQVSLKDVFWILRTQNQPGGMCQSGFDNVGHLHTTCSFIGHPKTGDLWLTNGNPASTHYEHYRLAD